MRQVVPWIVSESLLDAREQIATLRVRVRESATYDRAPLTSQMRATFMAMLDEIERDEVANARQSEEERLKRVKQNFESATKQRAAALTEITTAIEWLSDGISRVQKSDVAARNAAREAGMDLPDIRPEIQKLVQAVSAALQPLKTLIDND